MTTTLAKPEANGHAEEFDVELIRRTVAKGATNDELSLYLHDCQRRGVHPLDRMLHFTIRVDKQGVRRYTPITSIDLFRARAGETNEHAGTDDAVYVTEDGTQYPAVASVTVYRLKSGLRCPFTATARWKEYKPAKDDFMWIRMPYTMLAKCAEALALRKAFPAELGGLYTQDEMAQAQSHAVEPAMTVEANVPTPEQVAATAQAPKPPKIVYCSDRQKEAIQDLYKEARLNGTYWTDVLTQHNVKRLGNLTADKAAGVILDLCRNAVKTHLVDLEFNLDDVRKIDSSVVADIPDELTQEEADAALGVLRKCKELAAN